MTQELTEREKAVQRCAELRATADLFDIIAVFMAETSKGTWADYEAAVDEVGKSPLRMKHREAMRIRDDYTAAAKENRNDIAMIEALLRASAAEGAE